MKNIFVRFMANQGAEDLFFCSDNKRVYCRQPSNDSSKVTWLTTSKWQGGYEASAPLRSDIVVNVVDKKGNVLFTEQNNDFELSERNYLFSREQIRALSISLAYKFHLSTFNEWKSNLLKIKIERGFNDECSDNTWLYCKWNEIEREVLAEYYIYGVKHLRVVKSKQLHTLSGCVWYEYSSLYDDDTVSDLIGYEFVKEE